MDRNVMLDILLKCRTLDGAAVVFYQRMAEQATQPGEMREFWQRMAREEESHVRFWERMISLATEGAIPVLFERPGEVMADLEHTCTVVDQVAKAGEGQVGTKDALLLAQRVEFYMLHPAFESFFSFARGVGELADLPPIREEHEQHVNSFLEVLRRHAGGSPELGLAAEMLGRLWRRNRELAELSKTDALTQVLNRRGFFDAARSVAHLSQRHGYPVGVLLLDVDDFKQVNDQFGHEAGDRALAAVAGKVAGSVRRSDLVGRLGGEEFGVFLSRIETGGALAAGEKTRQAVAGIDTLGFAVTVSVGAVAGSLAVPVEEGLEGLMRRADAAMYRAKAEGKNRVVAERP